MVVRFKVESWAALAPSLEQEGDWLKWLSAPKPIDEPLQKIPLKEIPPLLRRRFNMLGKCAMGAVLQVVKEDDRIPSIFASRHGDTALTLSLLEEMGKDEPMSPTNFSLAVHNAVSGLYSIARKDTSAVTSIAAMSGLVLNTLFEAVGQLQEADRILCVVYDAPLPALYQSYCSCEPFPYAIAMILTKEQGEAYTIEQLEDASKNTPRMSDSNAELLPFMSLLTGLSSNMKIQLNNSEWVIKRQDVNASR